MIHIQDDDAVRKAMVESLSVDTDSIEMAFTVGEMAEHCLNSLKALSGDGWVSVKERLPDYDVAVLVARGKEPGNIAIMSYDDGARTPRLGRHWRYWGRSSPWEISHWRPLPAPPEEKREEVKFSDISENKT